MKENQKKSYEFAKDIIYENEYKGNCNVVTKHYSFNEGHGRQEERTCIVVSYGDIMQKMFKNKFIGLRSVVGKSQEDLLRHLVKHQRKQDTT